MTTLKVPSGRPASATISAKRSADTDVCSDGLRTKLQPAASAGASLNAVSSSGEFHGMMAPTTPTGSNS